MPVYRRGKKWYLDFRVNGCRYREVGGVTRKAAEVRLARRMAEVADGDEMPVTRQVRLEQFVPRYLERAKARKRSWERDEDSTKHLLRHLGKMPLRRIDHAAIERYQSARLAEKNESTGRGPRPGTINREVTCLKALLSLAMRERVIGRHPAQGARMLDEDNVRDRIVSRAELDRIMAAGPAWLRPVCLLGYHTAMRLGEIVGLRWEQVDLREGFVRLRAEDTKDRENRSVPLAEEAIEALRALPRAIQGGRIFARNRKAASVAFGRAAREAGVEGVRFHDLRHTRITLWRRDGHDYFRIMAASGHRTMSVFRRYNTVDEAELSALVGRSGVDTSRGTAEADEA